MSRRRKLPLRRPRLGYRGIAPTYELEDIGVRSVVPYGNGLALVDNTAAGGVEDQVASGLWLRVEVRDGRPQLVAIESRDSDYPFTTTALRLKLAEIVDKMIRGHSVRIMRDPETGEQFGIPVESPTGPGERRSIEERTRDIVEASGAPKRGRPKLSDAFLEQVLSEYKNAKDSGGRSASQEVADLHNVVPATVRQWMFKARKRGLATKEETNG